MNRSIMPTVLTGLITLALSVPGLSHAQLRLGVEGNQQQTDPFTNPEDDSFGSRMVAGDFNGDGTGDLYIRGFNTAQARILIGLPWTIGQASPPIPFFRSTETMPAGTNLTIGDFDGDGRDEIALGYPSDPALGASRGSVSIMDRSTAGAWSTQEIIRIGSDGYIGTAVDGDALGASLVSGDFDNDGYDDLAIGASGRSYPGTTDAGAVLVVYGSSSGIGPARSKLFARATDGLGVDPEEADRYGSDLVVADFTNDGYDDLVIDIPNARCANGVRSGAVVILRGSSTGLVNTQSRSYFPGEQGIPGSCTSSTQNFGEGLAVGRFNADTRPDLAIGAPGSSAAPDRGSVTVLMSSITGPGPDGAEYIRGIDLPTPIAQGGVIGRVMAAGRLLGTGTFDSLVLGASEDDVAGVDGAGSVWILHASASGISPTRSERWTLRAPMSLAPAATNDRFGGAVAIADFNDDGASDLAIGITDHDAVALDAGAVQIIYQSEFIFRNGFEN